MSSRRRGVVLGAVALLATVGVAGAITVQASAAPQRTKTPVTTVPHFDHVVVTYLENEDAAATFEDPTAAPNLARLRTLGSYVPQYFGVGHNSLDNYLALFGGEEPTTATEADCLGKLVGSCEYPATVPTLGSSLDAAGKSWKIYSEGMAGVLGTGGDCLHQTDPDLPDVYQGPGSNGYATRHNPAMWFDSVIDDGSYCDAHSVDYTQLATDDRSGSTLPTFSFVEPDTCHDGHDDTSTGCLGDPEGATAPDGVAALDAWLGDGKRGDPGFVSQLLNSRGWRSGNNLLVITFDEALATGAGSDASGCTSCHDGSDGGRIGALFIGTGVRAGYVSTYVGDHYGLLRTIEQSEGLPTLASQAASPAARATVMDGSAKPITDIFRSRAATTSSTT